MLFLGFLPSLGLIIGIIFSGFGFFAKTMFGKGISQSIASYLSSAHHHNLFSFFHDFFHHHSDLVNNFAIGSNSHNDVNIFFWFAFIGFILLCLGFVSMLFFILIVIIFKVAVASQEKIFMLRNAHAIVSQQQNSQNNQSNSNSQQYTTQENIYNTNTTQENARPQHNSFNYSKKPKKKFLSFFKRNKNNSFKANVDGKQKSSKKEIFNKIKNKFFSFHKK